MVRMVVVMTSRTCLFLMGFFWITVDDQRNKDITKEGCFGKVSIPLKTSVTVSNHLSFMDIMVLASKCDAPSFVAKHSVKSVFLVGRVACCLGSLFVNLSKTSQDPSQSLSQQIISRQHFFDRLFPSSLLFLLQFKTSHALCCLNSTHSKKDNPGIPSLVIFPEGTTTNGSAIGLSFNFLFSTIVISMILIFDDHEQKRRKKTDDLKVQFRKGAFLAGHPVQIVCVKSVSSQ